MSHACRVLIALGVLSCSLCAMSVSAADVSQRGENSPYLQYRDSRALQFRHGRTFHFSDGLAITLLSYAPATGLTQFPGGPVLCPHTGYRFVTTSWLVQNTVGDAVSIGTWVAKSRGLTSREFVTGNGGQPGIVPARASHRYYWLFEVARVGKVAIFYRGFQDHWLPRR